MVGRKSTFLALKSLTFASPRLLPLALYLLSRESTPPIGKRGEALLGNCLRYLGRRCHGSRRSADVHLDSAFTWPIPVILRDLIAVIAVVVATIFSPSQVPDDIHGFTLLAIDINGYSSETREKERGRERAKLQDIAVREERKREAESVRNYSGTRPVSSIDLSILGIQEADATLRFHASTMTACVTRISRIRIQ